MKRFLLVVAGGLLLVQSLCGCEKHCDHYVHTSDGKSYCAHSS